MGRKKTEPADETPEAAPAEDVSGELDQFWDAIQDLEPGELGAGRYRLYKTPERELLLVYRPSHTDTDQHFLIPSALITMAKMASKGPLGALARMQARRALGGPGD